MADKLWAADFGPSFTPEQALRRGIFEGKYINAVKGLPKDWYKIPKVLGKNDEPDPTINYYGVKSRQPLSIWKDNGWVTKNSPLGWWQWYCHYWLGRRLGEEDEWQIGRWRSFVARHSGQLKSNCRLGDEKCSPKQRQGLLQWGWDSTKAFDDEMVLANARRMAKLTKTTLSPTDSHEDFDIFKQW